MTTSRPAFLASLAAASLVPSALEAQALTHVAIGTAPIDAGMPPVIAQKTGIFQRNGIDADVEVLSSGAAATAALVSGAIQCTGTSVMGVIAAHLKGVQFQIIAPASVYISDKPSELLVVRKDSPIQKAADLNGKTVSAPALGDLFSITMFAWVDQNGGDSRTLREIELPPAATPAALAAGRIDAAVLTEPLLSQTINSGVARVLGKPYDAIAPRFMIAAVVAMADWVSANKDTVAHLARAFLQANAFGNAHPDQTAPWLADFTKVDVTTIEHGHREMFDEALIPASLQRVIDAAARYKAIDHAFDAHDLISPIALGIKP